MVDFEGQAFAEVQVIIEEVRVQNSPIADEGASDDAREFILLSESTGVSASTATKAIIKSRFADILPPGQSLWCGTGVARRLPFLDEIASA